MDLDKEELPLIMNVPDIAGFGMAKSLAERIALGAGLGAFISWFEGTGVWRNQWHGWISLMACLIMAVWIFLGGRSSLLRPLSFLATLLKNDNKTPPGLSLTLHSLILKQKFVVLTIETAAYLSCSKLFESELA